MNKNVPIVYVNETDLKLMITFLVFTFISRGVFMIIILRTYVLFDTIDTHVRNANVWNQKCC